MKLSSMTWDDVEKEMSIAGSPEKIAQLGRQIESQGIKKSERHFMDKFVKE